MKALVFYTSTDSAKRPDATGAFIPEAEAFSRVHRLPFEALVPVPQSYSQAKRRSIVNRALRDWVGPDPLDAVVYFGHGTRRGLPGLGVSLYHPNGDGVRWLADRLEPVLAPTARVVLFACLSGKDHGYADELDRALPGSIRTIAHLTAGHTSWNPYTEYSGEGPTRSGVPIIATSDPLWPVWLRRLRDDQAFRLSFPFMSRDEIRLEIGADHVPPGPSRLMEEA